MKRSGKKYETNFFIVSAAAQERMYAKLKTIAPELTAKLIEWFRLEDEAHTPLSKCWHESPQSPIDSRFARLMLLFDVEVLEKVILGEEYFKLMEEVQASLGQTGHTIRPNGGEWDVYGMEKVIGYNPTGVSCHGVRSNKTGFRHYRFEYEGINHASPSHISLLQDAILEKITLATKADENHGILDGFAKEDVNFLLTNGYILQRDQSYQLTFPIIEEALLWNMEDDQCEKSKIQAMNPAASEKIGMLKSQAIDIANAYYKFCEKEIMNEVPSFLQEDKWQIRSAIVSSMYMARGAIFEEALRIGYLQYDPAADHRMLGALFIL
jgi:hypothetical protein